MLQRSGDLTIAILFSIAGIMLTIADVGSGLIRALVSIPLVSVLPGYALTALLLPGRALGVAERCVLSLGLSLTLTALGGLVLHGSPWGLQSNSWAVLLGTTTAALSGVALLRRSRVRVLQARQPLERPRPSTGALFALATLMATGSLGLAVAGAQQTTGEGFTQLWALPDFENQQRVLRIGLVNRERASVTYRLQVRAGGALLQEWPSFELSPGMEWANQAQVAPNQLRTGPFEVLLYRAEAPETVYRRVLLWPEAWRAGRP